MMQHLLRFLMQHLLRFRAWLESVPYSLLALPLRFSVAWIFWNAGQVKPVSYTHLTLPTIYSV